MTTQTETMKRKRKPPSEVRYIWGIHKRKKPKRKPKEAINAKT